MTHRPGNFHGSSPTRGSPFRRPESPASPSPLRISTPAESPTKTATTPRLNRPGTASSAHQTWAPKAEDSDDVFTDTPQTRANMHARARSTQAATLLNGNALSQLPAGQVRTLRDSFQILDRDCDGVVNRDDVADMLQQLGVYSYLSPYPRLYKLTVFFYRPSVWALRCSTILPSIETANDCARRISQLPS